MKMGASAKVIGVMSYKRKWKEGRERVTAAAGCSLTHSVTYSTHFVFARNEQSVFLLSGQHMLAWTGYHWNAPGLV